MELSYFRKSTRSFSETLQALKKAVPASGLTILAEKELEKDKKAMVLACNPDWARRLIDADHRIAGFLPCSFLVFEKDGAVYVGSGEASIIRSLIQGGPLVELAIEAESASRAIIHEAAGVGELKPMDVLVYATMTCPYCTKVKEWLTAHKIEHKVVHVDLDREAGRAMVEKTGQMGVPVTEISYGEDAEPAFVLGFDEARLMELLATR